MRSTMKVVLGIAILVLAGRLAASRTPNEVRQADISGSSAVRAARVHVSTDDVEWMTTNRYPEWFRKTYRYKELVGWISNWQDAKAAEWKGVANREVRMGILNLDRGAVYPFHFHPAPELYYVIRGTAEWTVGTETFRATPGTAIHAPANAHHKMVNVGDGTLELLYVWWAPGGDSKVLDAPSQMGDGW